MQINLCSHFELEHLYSIRNLFETFYISNSCIICGLKLSFLTGLNLLPCLCSLLKKKTVLRLAHSIGSSDTLTFYSYRSEKSLTEQKSMPWLHQWILCQLVELPDSRN